MPKPELIQQQRAILRIFGRQRANTCNETLTYTVTIMWKRLRSGMAVVLIAVLGLALGGCWPGVQPTPTFTPTPTPHRLYLPLIFRRGK